MIRLRLDELLEERGKTSYWLAKESGVSHNTLWRFKTGRSNGIQFDVLEKLCTALGCAPGDLLVMVEEKSKRKAKR